MILIIKNKELREKTFACSGQRLPASKGIYSRVNKVTNPLRIKSTLCFMVDKLKLIKENFSSGLGWADGENFPAPLKKKREEKCLDLCWVDVLRTSKKG